MPQKIILDCDPGHDDAFAILLAAGTPGLELVGITTVAGNQTLEKTTLNAQRVCSVAGLDKTPIAAGCDRPILRKHFPAKVHGESGLDGPSFPEPTVDVSAEHGVDFIVRTVMESDGDITVVATGPLTNIAMALRREPRIAEKAQRVVMMGGAYSRGNVTPAAEFNIAVDPEAAAMVFEADWLVTMIGLEVTHQALATPDVFRQIELLDTPLSQVVIDMLEFARSSYRDYGFADPPIHDPCAVAQVAFPELVGVTPAFVTVETRGDWTAGMTVVDFDGTLGRTNNAEVGTSLDASGLWDRIVGAIGRVGLGKGRSAGEPLE